MPPWLSPSDYSQCFSGTLSVLPDVKGITSTASILTSSILYLSLTGFVQNLASARMNKVIKTHTALMSGMLLPKLQSSKFMSYCCSMTSQGQSTIFLSFNTF